MGQFKVLFVSAWYPSKASPCSGVFVREHAKAVALYDDIVVVHIEKNREARWFSNEIQITTEHGIRTIRTRAAEVPLRGISQASYVLHLLRIVRALSKEGWRPDIIAAQVFRAALPCVELGRLLRVPVVVTEHISAFQGAELPKRVMQRAKSALERAEIVLPVSKALARDIQDCGINARIDVVPNVVDTDFFHPADQPVQKSGAMSILFIGLLVPKKNLSCLLEVLSRLHKNRNDFVLEVIGEGPHRDEYEARVQDLGLTGLVNFHGYQSKSDLAAMMRRSHFLVLPSEYETFGCVALEAIASGIPVVVSDVGGLREFVQPHVGIRVPPGDVSALAEAVDYMLDHQCDYDRSELARYARERYSPEIIGRKLHDVYEEVVTGCVKTKFDLASNN